MEEQTEAGNPAPDPRVAELEAKLALIERRYNESSEEGKRLARLNQQLQAQAFETPRQDVPQRNTAGQRLTEYGIPVDALDEYIHAKANALVEEKFAPIVKGMQARQTMVGRYKNYAKFESQVGELINTDAEFAQTYNRVFQADPAAAMELAYFKVGEVERRSRGNRPQSQPELEEEQAEAQIPSQRSGDARRNPGAKDVAIEQARDTYRKNPNRGTAEALFRARMKTVISDDFLNQ